MRNILNTTSNLIRVNLNGKVILIIAYSNGQIYPLAIVHCHTNQWYSLSRFFLLIWQILNCVLPQNFHSTIHIQLNFLFFNFVYMFSSSDEMQPFVQKCRYAYYYAYMFTYCIDLLSCFGHSHYLLLQSGVT